MGREGEAAALAEKFEANERLLVISVLRAKQVPWRPSPKVESSSRSKECSPFVELVLIDVATQEPLQPLRFQTQRVRCVASPQSGEDDEEGGTEDEDDEEAESSSSGAAGTGLAEWNETFEFKSRPRQFWETVSRIFEACLCGRCIEGG
jgi:hypothetical protein